MILIYSPQNTFEDPPRVVRCPPETTFAPSTEEIPPSFGNAIRLTMNRADQSGPNTSQGVNAHECLLSVSPCPKYRPCSTASATLIIVRHCISCPVPAALWSPSCISYIHRPATRDESPPGCRGCAAHVPHRRSPRPSPTLRNQSRAISQSQQRYLRRWFLLVPQPP